MNLYAGRDEPTVVCDGCGARFREVRESCPRCGAARTRQQPGAAQTTGRRPSETALTVGGLVLATLVLGLLARPSQRQGGASARASLLGAPPSLTVVAGAVPPGQTDEVVARGARAGTPAFLDAKGAAALAYAEGRVEDALAHFQEVLEPNPDDPEALNNVGQVLVRMGRASEALPYLERAASRFPDRWDFQFNLARALGEADRWAEAVERYRLVATHRPDDDVTAFNLARALERAGQTPEAIAGYQRAVQLAPGDPSFHLALALAHERAGDLQAARRAYQGYLGLLPEGDEAERVRAHILALPEGTVEGAGETPRPE